MLTFHSEVSDVRAGCVSVFVKMLEALDADTVHLCLDALKIILYLKVVLVDDMDSLNMIQSLQYHPNKGSYVSSNCS